MSFTFLMEMEHIFIQESFVAKAAKQRVFRLNDLSLNPRDEFFPAIERFWLPFLLEHFVRLLTDPFPVNQRVQSLEEVFKVVG